MDVMVILESLFVRYENNDKVINSMDLLKEVLKQATEADDEDIREETGIELSRMKAFFDKAEIGFFNSGDTVVRIHEVGGRNIEVKMTHEFESVVVDVFEIQYEEGKVTPGKFLAIIMDDGRSLAGSFVNNFFQNFQGGDILDEEDYEDSGVTLGDLLEMEPEVEEEVEEKEKRVLFRRKEIGLLSILTAKKYRKNILVVGKAGVGKDALIMEFVKQHADSVNVLSIKRSTEKVPLGNLMEREGNKAKREGRKYVYVRQLENLLGTVDDKARENLCAMAGNISKAVGVNYIIAFDSEQVNGNASFDKVTVKALGVDNVSMVVWPEIMEMTQANGVEVEEGVLTKFIKDIYTGSVDRLLDSLDTLIVIAKQLFNGKLNPATVEYYYESVRIQADPRAEGTVGNLKGIRERIESRLIGQEEAVEKVVRAIKRNKAGVRVGNRPIGTFLFVGPTGVGKTELVKVLARELNGTENSIIRFDMSEFSEGHSVSKLIGSPPGYVGHDDGGQLTKRIKERPESIVLFDEIEKAHGNVFNMMLQIMDEGRLTDSKGETVDFTKAIIVMTSNAGYSDEANGKRSIGFATTEFDENKMANEQVLSALETTFRPEFLNRIDSVVKFNRLRYEEILTISKLLIGDVIENLAKNGYRLEVAEEVYEHIAKAGFSDKYGARNIKRAIQEEIEDYLADRIIDDEMEKERKYTLSIVDGQVRFKP